MDNHTILGFGEMMGKTRKVVLFVFGMMLALASVVCVAGCGGDETAGPTVADYAGKYVFESSESEAGTYTADNVSSMATPEQMCTLELNDDGTFSLSTFGNNLFSDTATPTWKVIDDGVKLIANGEEMPAVYDTENHTLTLSVDSNGSTTTMVLKRTSN